MGALAQVNATMVSAKGSSSEAIEDYGEPVAGTSEDEERETSGAADAYFQERVIRSTASGTLDLITETTLLVDSDDLEDELESGDSVIVTLEADPGTELEHTVRDIKTSRLAGHPAITKVWLEPGGPGPN
jgi:hypothetical protein